MDYSKMSKKQLVEYIEKLINQRAFSYEDRMKLQIIDQAPLTLWACDSELKIRLWSCQCENMYGYSRDEVLGQEYLQLFVAPDEQMASKKDCLEIIEKGTPFFNCVAQDEGRKGKRNIITNCFRIHDVETNEFLQAEIGLDISNLDSEKEKYDQVIMESKQIILRKAQLLDLYRNMEIKFGDIVDKVEVHIKENERKTLSFGPGIRTKYKREIKYIVEKLNEIKKEIDDEIRQIEMLISNITSLYECDNIDKRINKISRTMKNGFEEIMLDLDESFLITTNCEPNFKKGETVEEKTKKKRFRIALSFPGEYRDSVVEKIANSLSNAYSRDEILYDKFHQAEFARLNLDTYLQTLYHDESELLVIFICEDYNNKPWCGIEWRAIRDLSHDKNEANKIMLIKVGNGKVDGVFSSLDGYIEATDENTNEIVEQILYRYNLT